MFRPGRTKRIAVALSGGVDSSVAAHLLNQQLSKSLQTKIELLGIHMSNWDYHSDDDVSNESKCWKQDWKDAKAVAKHLDISIVHTSFEQDYWNDVFEPYVHQLSKNVTPNPDVDCNRYIKFGVLKDYLKERYDIDTLATGHYARVWDPKCDYNDVFYNTSVGKRSMKLPLYLDQALNEDPSLTDLILNATQPTLLAARDLSKDQSYFLSGVPGKALRNVLFPLGDLLKQAPASCKDSNGNPSPPSVRELALEADLPTAHKRDSMGICFVGKRNHASFVREYIGVPSESTATMGECINVEDGGLISTFDPNAQPRLLYATIGQGAKISGASQKWFVVDKPDATTLLVCPGTHHPALYSDRLYVDRMHWIAGVPPPITNGSRSILAKCRIRHLQPLVDCEIVLPKHDSGNEPIEIVLDHPLRGIAPGQVCAIYSRPGNGLVCLGSGTIRERGPTYWDMKLSLPTDLHPAGHNDLSAKKKRAVGE